jgi:RHS repeat-associated protein
MADPSGSTSWVYDSRGRVVDENKTLNGVTDPYHTGFTYNSADLPVSMTYPGGEVVSTDYLPQMAIKSVTGLADYATNSRYDASGRLVHREYGFGWFGFSDYDYNTWDYYYIPDPEHPEIIIPMGGKLKHVVSGDDYHTYQDNTYAYDANGNITSIIDTMTGTAQTQTFTYDEVNSLETASAVGGSQGTYNSETYLYDDLTGNLVDKGNGDLIYNPSSHPQAATAMGTDIYNYDDNGNMFSRDYEGENYQLTYDAESHLVKLEQLVEGDTYTTIGEYVYDGDGTRVRAVVNGVGTNYVGNYYEASPGSFTKFYYAGGQRVAWRINGTPYFGFSDHLGSTSVTVDINGAIVGNELYKAWGGERYSLGSIQTTFKYTGQREAEAGLYFYNARWYDPEVGRFIQADTDVPESQGSTLGFDRYAYVGNNPVNHIDPSGHCWGFASGLREWGAYTTTCSNMDAALSIVQHPEANFGQQALAGGYIAAEAIAHAGVVVGMGLAACSTIVACASVVETTLGIGTAACADGDCANEAHATMQGADSIWRLSPFERGWKAEGILGTNLAPNFPVIDRFTFSDGTATSIKSINLFANSYQNSATLNRTVQGYIGKLAGWNGAQWTGVTILPSDIVTRNLELVIPLNVPQAQWDILNQLRVYASEQGVNLIFKTIR